MGNMRFKEGDRVRIKSIDWYNENKDNYGIVEFSTHVFVPGMSQFCGKVMTIEDVFEDVDGNVVYYMEKIDYDWTDEMIEGLVEEEMPLDKAGQITDFEYEGLAYTLPEGYQFVDENGNVINATKIVLEKKKKEYPKTFEECVHVLEGGNRMSLEQMNTFRKLIDARNAYWKLYGDEMGLGKSWKPDWNTSEPKYVISCTSNGIEKQWETTYCKGFSFPTEEMRDAFYENFKELIESVKELL